MLTALIQNANEGRVSSMRIIATLAIEVPIGLSRAGGLPMTSIKSRVLPAWRHAVPRVFPRI